MNDLDYDEEIAAEELRMRQLSYMEDVLNLALKVHYLRATEQVSVVDAIDDEFEALLAQGWPA